MTRHSISLALERKRPRPLGLTPLVDVIFILVIFYLLVSQFAQLRTLDVTVNEGSGAAPAAEIWTISISAPNSISFNGEPTSVETIASELRLQNPNENTSVVVSVAPAVPLQTAVTLLEAVKGAGITTASLRAWRTSP